MQKTNKIRLKYVKARPRKNGAQKVTLINIKFKNVRIRLENMRARLENVSFKSVALGIVRFKTVKPQRSFLEFNKIRHLQLYLPSPRNKQLKVVTRQSINRYVNALVVLKIIDLGNALNKRYFAKPSGVWEHSGIIRLRKSNLEDQGWKIDNNHCKW